MEEVERKRREVVEELAEIRRETEVRGRTVCVPGTKSLVLRSVVSILPSLPPSLPPSQKERNTWSERMKKTI